ncbi:conserved hypothetical protein [Candidatus Magnetomoraceae bacterium gMMP-1]
MYPIYFPFTFISDPVMQAFSNCFERITIYQPSRSEVPAGMKEWSRKEKLDIRFPLDDVSDEQKLAGILSEYRRLGANHGPKMNHLRAISGSIPFFDDTSISQIRADIKGSDTSSKKKQSPIEAAQIFLVMAQDMDIQRYELDIRLGSFKDKENEFVKSFKKYADNYEDAFEYKRLMPSNEDPGSYKTHERLSGWAQLLKHDQIETGVMLTRSPSIIDHLLENISIMKEFFQLAVPPASFRGIKEWQPDLLECLNNMTNQTWSEQVDRLDELKEKYKGEESDNKLILYVVPETSPGKLFSNFTKENNEIEGQIKNTIIGLLE